MRPDIDTDLVEMGLRDVGRKEFEESQCAQLSLQVTPGMEASGYSCTVGCGSEVDPAQLCGES